MKIAIVDDDVNDRELLIQLIKASLEHEAYTLDITQFDSGESLLEAFEPEQFDICFLDIYMKEMNGMTVARKLRALDPDLSIVFLTSSKDYVYEGYEIHALRYLLKPPQAEYVQAVLFECLKQSRKNQRRLTVSVGKKIHEIPYRNLLYIMSVGNNIEIHFQDSHLNLSARHTFSKTVAPLLTDERFLTCARGIVVNLSHVKDIQKDGFLMDNGEFVPISRRLYPSVKNTYIDFQFEHILS